MSRDFSPKVVTASDLRSGDVVYLTAEGGWSRRHADAALLTDEADAQIRLIEALQQAGRVVGAYLAEARAGRDGPEPVHFREAIRARGPSNYPHGKQTQPERA